MHSAKDGTRGFPGRRGSCWTRRWSWPEGWAAKSGHRPSAVGDAAIGRRPGGPFSGREEHLGAGGAAAAFRRAERHGPPAGSGRHGGRPAPGDGLRRHRGAERPPEPGRAGTPALRHAGRRRLRRRGHAGFDGRPAHRGGAGVPPARGSSSCPSSPGPPRLCREGAGPATNTAAT